MMNQSEVIATLMFDYESLDSDSLDRHMSGLSSKHIRWLAQNHPDNRIRKHLLRATNVKIGQGSVINTGIVVSDNYKELLSIGARVAISPNVTIICASSPNNSLLTRIAEIQNRYIREEIVSIGDDSWIGAGVILLPGVNIGKFCVIGAGAVVTNNVDDSCVVAGVPARLINKLKHEN